MKLTDVIIGVLIVLVLALGAIVGLLFISTLPDEILPEKSPSVFSVLEVGTAADNAYAVFNYRGEGNITLITLDSKPTKRVTIINDSNALHATKLPELVDEMRELEDYGYEIIVTNKSTIGSGLYIIPTGAIPSYALFSLQQNTSNGTLIYIGEKDLILSRGIKQQAWYDSLTEEQKERLVQYDGTLDDFLDEENNSISDTVLHMNWSKMYNSTMDLTESGLDTGAVELEDEGYLRIIYEVDELRGIYDSPKLHTADTFVNPDPDVVFPWQKSTLRFSLNKTNGTAFLSINKDGKEVKRDLLRRVSDENVFLEKLQYDEPGEYIIEIEDNSGVVATGYLHVNDLDIDLVARQGMLYIFSVNVDGEPVSNTDAHVSLGESENKEKYFVSDGKLTLIAKLDQGLNVFNIEIYDTNVPVIYDNRQENFLEFYVKYGTPAILLIVMVYFGVRLSKKPIYRLRFGEAATFVRQEIRIPAGSAIESFRKIRADMNLGKAPITPEEFAISLKRYMTNGADITEGNVEEMLKKLVKNGRLETYRDYYQLPGEGDIKKNALRRIIREKLIQNGTMFDEIGGKFVTKDYEIGFYGQSFSKKGIMVVEDKSEAKRILSHLSDRESARLRLMQANEKIELVPIDRLDDVL